MVPGCPVSRCQPPQFQWYRVFSRPMCSSKTTPAAQHIKPAKRSSYFAARLQTSLDLTRGHRTVQILILSTTASRVLCKNEFIGHQYEICPSFDGAWWTPGVDFRRAQLSKQLTSGEKDLTPVFVLKADTLHCCFNAAYDFVCCSNNYI